MSISSHGFVEWKEEFISQERGSRVVHYFLKNSDGDSVLAVVGTERSLRHMVYVVSDEFLHFCGSEKSNQACFKWRSRREVVDWLTSLLSKQQSSQDHSSTHPFKSNLFSYIFWDCSNWQVNHKAIVVLRVCFVNFMVAEIFWGFPSLGPKTRGLFVQSIFSPSPRKALLTNGNGFSTRPQKSSCLFVIFVENLMSKCFCCLMWLTA